MPRKFGDNGNQMCGKRKKIRPKNLIESIIMATYLKIENVASVPSKGSFYLGPPASDWPTMIRLIPWANSEVAGN